MYHQLFQSLRKSNFPPTKSLPKTTTLFNDAIRKDSIIKKLVASISYKAGDICCPVETSDVEEWGHKIEVVHITQSYSLMGRDENWPENDNPLIVYCFSEKANKHFFCTTNFLKLSVMGCV